MSARSYPEPHDLSVPCPECRRVHEYGIYYGHCDYCGNSGRVPAKREINWPLIRGLALYLIFLGVVVWRGYHVFGEKP